MIINFFFLEKRQSFIINKANAYIFNYFNAIYALIDRIE